MRTVNPSAKDSLRVLGGEGGRVLMCFILSVGYIYIVSSHLRESLGSLHTHGMRNELHNKQAVRRKLQTKEGKAL
jgi:hypothetical protein